MNRFTSNICIGCIGGLYAGLILVSLVALIFVEVEYSGKELLTFYGYAMLVGTIIGGAFSWLKFHKRAKSERDCDENNSPVSKLELASVIAILILGVVLIAFSIIA